MSDKKIAYINRNFDDYKSSLTSFIKQYYPDIANDFNDASIGSWLIDLVAAVGDNLSYHIDRVYSETCLDSAQEKSSLYNLARSNGFKVPGPKGAMTEVKFSCNLPVVTSHKNDSSTVGMPNWYFAPKIKKGTKLSSGSQIFEVMEDIDFGEQFDNNGVSNRTVTPNRDANSKIQNYTITKTATVIAGESMIYSQVLDDNSIKPFMEIIIPSTNVMNVESVLFKKGNDFSTTPTNNEFSMNREYTTYEENGNTIETYRFFEVNSLLDQYRWGDASTVDGTTRAEMPTKYMYGFYNQEGDTLTPTVCVTKGKWIPLTQKFITEFTDKGYLKIIFGSGEQASQTVDYDCAKDFTKAQISRMIQNNNLGKLPPKGQGGEWTMYIKYRVGGGASSNIAANTLTNISYLDVEIGQCITTAKDQEIANAVKNTIKVTNTIPSVSGKDAPTVDELRNMIKYNNAAQERCVTIKDYENRILMMPPKYGCPFRVGVTEENNKVMVYLIGIDYLGYLTTVLPVEMIKNIENYLSMYRSINDFVEIKSGRIINLSFETDIFVDKTYNTGDVVKNVINTIKEYMDINKRYMGEDIYVGDIQKEISKVDGVLNLIDLRVYNEIGDGYSTTITTQEIAESTDDEDVILSNNKQKEIDLDASDYVLLSESDCIFEIKYPEKDIRIRVKTR